MSSFGSGVDHFSLSAKPPVVVGFHGCLIVEQQSQPKHQMVAESQMTDQQWRVDRTATLHELTDLFCIDMKRDILLNTKEASWEIWSSMERTWNLPWPNYATNVARPQTEIVRPTRKQSQTMTFAKPQQ